MPGVLGLLIFYDADFLTAVHEVGILVIGEGMLRVAAALWTERIALIAGFDVVLISLPSA